MRLRWALALTIVFVLIPMRGISPSLYHPISIGHNTGNFMPCSTRIVCPFFNVPQWTYKHGSYLWGQIYGLSSLSEKTWKSNHLLIQLLRQHFLLSYFKTLSVGPAGVELTTYRMTARCSTNWATRARCKVSKRRFYFIHFKPEQHKTISIYNVS